MANSDKDIKITPNTGQSDSPKIEVTGANATTKTLTINDDGSITFDSDLTVQGNFTVSGTTTTFDTDTLNVQDNIITVNEGETGAGVTAGTAGIEVDRGTATNATILYDESIDGFVVDSKGTGRTAKFVNQHGYIELGPQNTSYAHITTDLSRFYFNRDLVIGENAISSYNGDFSVRRSQSTDEQIVIGDNSMTFTSAGNDVVTVDGTNTRLGINNASPSSTLHVTGDIAASTTIQGSQFRLYGSANRIGLPATNEIGIFTDSTERVRIDDIGRLGIGTTDPVSPLHIDHNVSNPSTDAPNSFGIYIDSDLTGSTATGGDREQGGIFIDLDTSATGGDASDEHRPIGVWADVRINSESDADAVYGIYGYTEAQRSGATGATTGLLRGGYFFAGSDETSDHTVSDLTGALGYASIQDAGTVSTSEGLRGYTNVHSSRTTNVGNLRGVSSEVDISGSRTDGSDITTGYSAVFHALLDHNPAASGEGTVTVANSYLYYGTSSITDSSQVTNNYGLYLSGEDKNYFSGSVGIGTTSPVSELDLNTGALSFANTNTALKLTGGSNVDFQLSHWGNAHVIIDADNNDTSRYFAVSHGNATAGSATELFRIQEDGKVGIGVSAPTDTLAISGGIKIGEFNSTDGTGYAGTSPPSDHNNVTGGGDPQIRVAGRTSDAPGIIQMAYFDSNNFFGGTGEFILGRLQYAMNENSNTVTTVAEIRGITSDPQTAGNFDGALKFLTSQGDASSANLTEKMILTSDGYLGIGTTSPDGQLHISSGNSGDCTVIIQADEDNNAEGDVPRLWFKADGDITEGAVQLSDNEFDIISNTASGGGIRFLTGSTSNTGTTDPATSATVRVDINDSGFRLGNGGARVTNILDEDDMASNSATALATQQSIKAYVDSQSGGSTSPAGSDSQIQYNNGGSFGGDADFTWDDTNNRLVIGSVTSQHDGLGKLTVKGTDASFLLEKHDDSASGGPTMTLYRYSASVADGDLIGQVNFRGEGSTGNPSTYMSLRTEIVDTTEGTKDAKLIMRGLQGNTQTEFMQVGQKVQIGPESINPSGVTTGKLTISRNDTDDLFAPTLMLVDGDADANNGPMLKMYRNTSSPADNDQLGSIQFNGEDSNGNERTYSSIRAISTDVTSGTNDGKLNFQIMHGGLQTTSVDLDGTGLTLSQGTFNGNMGTTTYKPAVFMDSGNINVTQTEVTIPFDTEILDPAGNATLATGLGEDGHIRLVAGGYYRISYSIPINDDGSTLADRTRVFVDMQTSSSSAFSSFSTVAQSRAQVYTREASGGSGLSTSFIYEHTANDYIRLRIDAQNNTDISTETNECQISIEYLGPA